VGNTRGRGVKKKGKWGCERGATNVINVRMLVSWGVKIWGSKRYRGHDELPSRNRELPGSKKDVDGGGVLHGLREPIIAEGVRRWGLIPDEMENMRNSRSITKGLDKD